MAAQQVRLRAGLLNLNCSVASFAALAVPPMVKQKLSQQQMNLVVNGRTELDEDETKGFLCVIDAMQHLQESVVPKVPIDWSNVLELKDTLVRTFTDRLNEEDPKIVQPVFVRLNVLNFFKGLRSNNTVIETMNYSTEGAAFENYELAEQAVAKLKAMGVTSTAQRLTAPRRKSTITISLEELGFIEPVAL